MSLGKRAEKDVKALSGAVNNKKLKVDKEEEDYEDSQNPEDNEEGEEEIQSDDEGLPEDGDEEGEEEYFLEGDEEDDDFDGNEEGGEEEEIDVKKFVEFVRGNLSREVEVDKKDGDPKSKKAAAHKMAILDKLRQID